MLSFGVYKIRYEGNLKSLFTMFKQKRLKLQATPIYTSYKLYYEWLTIKSTIWLSPFQESTIHYKYLKWYKEIRQVQKELVDFPKIIDNHSNKGSRERNQPKTNKTFDIIKQLTRGCNITIVYTLLADAYRKSITVQSRVLSAFEYKSLVKPVYY